LGFTVDDLTNRFYHNPMSRQQTGGAHGQAKVHALEHLMQQEGVEKRSCVAFLDDMAYNTDAAHRAGFTAVQVGGGGECGITDAQLAHTQAQLRSCIEYPNRPV
jgi:FMN phosphatase YigB (HAD superfamily)